MDTRIYFFTVYNALIDFRKKILSITVTLCFLMLVYATDVSAQLASCHSKFVGNIWYDGNMPSNYDRYFNQVTPENATKWSSVQGSGSNSWNWGQALNMYNYCKSRNIPFKFHTLVWGNQYPSWVDNASNKAAAVENWIREAGRTFPNCDFVDVVNECLPNHAQPSWRSAIGGENGLYGTGWDWVVWSFEKARQYFPNSKLLINDYNILNNSWNNDLDVLCQIANILRSRELIDGIGLQAHGLANTSGTDVSNRLNRITSLCPGLPIYISEFDLDIADDNQQRNKLAELFPIFWNNSAIVGVTFWGYLQGHTWIPNSHLIRSNGSERPSMVWLKEYLDCSGCAPTSITPYTQVNNGTWQQTATITVNSGDQIRFGPQPVSGGSWSWSGCETSGSSREQTVSPAGSCTATATYTNACGATSTQTFTVNVSGGGGGNTFNGVYSIVAQHSGKAVDVAGGGTSNGTNVQQWGYTSSNNNERFQVTHLGSGWHRISPVIATGQALDVSGVSTTNGANIQTWQYSGGNNQQWRFESAGNGYWKIVARHSNKCLDVSEVSTADGANIHQWDCITGAQNQAFQVIQNGSARMALHDTEILSDPSNDRGFTVYPNPSTSGDFMINVSSDNNKNYRLRIFTAEGKKVYETGELKSGIHEISTGLPKGMYLIKIDGIKTQKLIIN